MAKQKQLHQKHIPMRMCIVTKERKPKAELVRIVLIEDGSVIVDPKGKIRGRGANISMEIAVFDKAIKNGALVHALKLERKLQDEEITKLRNDFEAAIEEKKFRRGQRNVVLRVKKSGEKEVVEN